MADIRVLPQAVADKIAAGEVAERPSAVVKELVENSIDAGADRITVEIKNGGIKYIRVEDNGKGIPRDELEFAFVRHATSKIRDINDLFRIQTMGFRGEALASICAVADVEVLTRTKDSGEGSYMTLNHGVPSEKSAVACNAGTTMIVENLFANVPARMKFLKKDATEAGYVADIMTRVALSRPDISFCYICDGKEQFSTSGDGQLKNAVLKIYGIEFAKGVFEVNHNEHGVHITGVVGKPELARGNRTRQTLFVNGRYIKNHVVSKVVEEAYRNMLMTGRFPFFVLNIEIAPQLVDVNVHPAKTEIKFANEKEIYDIVYHAVKNALYARESSGNSVDEKAAAEKPQSTAADVSSKSDTDSSKHLESVYKPKNPAENPPDKKLISEFLKQLDETKPLKSVFNEAPIENIFKLPNGSASNEDSVPKADTSGADNIDIKTATAVETAEILGTSVTAEEDSGFIEEPAAAKIVGQVFDTYVIVEQGSEMFMIDQHAAHERKRFESLRKDYREKKVLGQVLLAPVVLDVDSSEIQVIRDNAAVLEGMGFVIEEFGRNSVIIRETPLIGSDDEIKNLVLELIPILSSGRPSALMSFEERALDMISCKYAIKANKRLSLPEMEALVHDVSELEKSGITTCPHGRPIKVRFTKREIEKMFKRIV